MRTRRPAFTALMGLVVLAAAGLHATDNTMKSTKPAAVAKDALECKPGEISACGLPSNVVIDMSKTKVQRTDAEWRKLKREEPALFQRAVMLERGYQVLKAQTPMRSVPFLHRTLVPLNQVDFSEDDSPTLWGNECEGMCGV